MNEAWCERIVVKCEKGHLCSEKEYREAYRQLCSAQYANREYPELDLFRLHQDQVRRFEDAAENQGGLFLPGGSLVLLEEASL